ncbi:MAG: beta-propeller fold lactonase family protein [Solirubrobacterales bacterium]|nr:beta-propeller fold lactonase family protein [Solirubrobacterales bacterium]
MHYPPRKFPRTILAAIAACVGAIAAPAVATAAQSHDAGYVYVDDNTSGQNTVAAFARHQDGTLTPVAGSPFNAGGAGSGSGLASQGAVQVSSDGRYVIAVDPGSSQVSVLRIRHDGTLKLVSVVSSGGVEPVSVAEHDGLVYVADAGAGGSNYTGFTLNRGGQLEPLADSTIALPDSAQPGDVLFNSTGSNLVGTRVGSSEIDSFSVGSEGRLTAAPGSPFAAQAAGPFGSEFRPTDPSQLFVSNAHAGPGNGTASAFSVASDGTLSSIGASPFADQQTAPCWVEITHDGQFLFTVNTGSGSISRYSIALDGTLTLLGSTQVASQAAVGAVDARLSADGQTLYVDESRIAALGAFAVDGGQLTELGSVSLPAGATPAGVAVR